MPDEYATWDDAIADGNVTDESDGYPDTYIVPLIQDLRSIGITTLQSCAGHVGKSDGELWIKDGPGVPQAMEWLNKNPDVFTYIKLVYWPELRWEIGWFPKDASQAISMIRKAFIYCERGFDQYLQASREADPDGETDGVILRREYIDSQGNTHFSMNDAEGYPVDSYGNELKTGKPSSIPSQGCICPLPRMLDDGSYAWNEVIRDDCPYHLKAAQNPSDHSIPWNCPTFWDGCNCKGVIAQLEAQLQDYKQAAGTEADLYDEVKQQNDDLWDLVLKVAEHERDCNNACSEKAAQTFIKNNRS